jgi:hypothetical protein
VLKKSGIAGIDHAGLILEGRGEPLLGRLRQD